MFVAVHLHVNEKNIYMRILQSDISFFYLQKLANSQTISI